jgi:hypothetical protein
MPSTRRHLNLNQGERTELARQETIEQVTALFLDLEHDHTWQEIADTVGLSVSALKRLTATGEFQTVYDEARATVGHDPRLKAVQSSLADLLPAARRRLEKIIVAGQDDRTAMRAIEKLFNWTGVDAGVAQDDPTAFANFLNRHNVTVEGDLNILQVAVPPEFQSAFQKYLHPEGSTDVLEGDVLSTASSEPSSEPAPALPSGLPAQTAESAPPEDLEPRASEDLPPQ